MKGKLVREYAKLETRDKVLQFALKLLGIDGGPGSGNYGHAGRPGKVGGSAKGSGGSIMRAGNKESGYTSFARHKEFKGIREAARNAPNVTKFLNSLTEDQVDALIEQYTACGTNEDSEEYERRFFKMMNHDNPKKTESKKWFDSLSPDDKDTIESWLDKYDSIGEMVNKDYSRQNIRGVLDKIGNGMGWKERILDRSFENLNDQELKDLNFLLDSFPWAEEGKYSKIPNEDFLYDGASYSIVQYYDALKAKALGIEDIEVPERPDGIKYVEKHGSVKEKLAAQDGGYAHTEAGNKFRDSVKKKLDSDKFFRVIDGTAESEKAMEGFRREILASVDNMDDRMAELVDRTIERAHIQWQPMSGTSNFNGSVIELYTNKSATEARSSDEMCSTFWHEYGHFVDSWYGKAGIEFQANPLNTMADTREGATQVAIQNNEYKKAAEKDVQNILDLAGIGDKYYAQMQEHGSKVDIRRRSDGKVVEHGEAMDLFDIQQAVEKALGAQCGYEEWRNFLTDRGHPKDINYDDYFETYTTPKRQQVKSREKFKGATDAYREALMNKQKKIDEWIESIGGDAEYQKLLIEREELYEKYQQKKAKVGYITDCIDDALNGALGLCVCWGGHTEDYYKAKVTPIETTANIFSARARNNADEIEFMNKFIPNISNLFTRAWRCDWSE